MKRCLFFKIIYLLLQFFFISNDLSERSESPSLVLMYSTLFSVSDVKELWSSGAEGVHLPRGFNWVMATEPPGHVLYKSSFSCSFKAVVTAKFNFTAVYKTCTL